MNRILGCDEAAYQHMFALTEADLNKKIIEFNAGLNSFNATQSRKQQHVLSVDPLYSKSLPELKHWAAAEFATLLQTVNAHPDRYCQHDLQVLIQQHEQVTHTLFSDYEQGRAQHRYVSRVPEELKAQSPPAFGLLLAHDLFLSNFATLAEFEQHLHTFLQLAEEVRIFPVLDQSGHTHALLAPILLVLQQQGLGVELRKVDYEWETGGHAMLRIWAQTCTI